MKQQYVCHQGLKSNKKALLRFYKTEHYSARLIGRDKWYFISDKDLIIAAVIVSQIGQAKTQYFLHGLVTSAAHKNQGLASQLIAHVQLLNQNIVCFADNSMSAFYLTKRFIKIPKQTINTVLVKELSLRFSRYKIRKPELHVFIYQDNCTDDICVREYI